MYTYLGTLFIVRTKTKNSGTKRVVVTYPAITAHHISILCKQARDSRLQYSRGYTLRRHQVLKFAAKVWRKEEAAATTKFSSVIPSLCLSPPRQRPHYGRPVRGIDVWSSRKSVVSCSARRPRERRQDLPNPHHQPLLSSQPPQPFRFLLSSLSIFHPCVLTFFFEEVNAYHFIMLIYT